MGPGSGCSAPRQVGQCLEQRPAEPMQVAGAAVRDGAVHPHCVWGAQTTEEPRRDAGWSGAMSSLCFIGDTENTLQGNASQPSPKWGHLPAWPAG